METNLSAEKSNVGKLLQAILIILFSVLSIGILYLLYKLWPNNPNDVIVPVTICHKQHHIYQEQQFLLLMILGGALGAMVHVLVSFTAFIGNDAFIKSWIPWYLLRPIIGASLALIFYLLIRGGLLSYSTTSNNEAPDSTVKIMQGINVEAVSLNKAKDSAIILFNNHTIAFKDKADSIVKADSIIKALVTKIRNNQPATVENKPAKPPSPVPLNPFGLMAVACLAGLFSKLAAKKLEEVFKSIFNVKDENVIPYKDKLPTDPKAPQAASNGK